MSGAKGDSMAEVAMQYNDGYNETHGLLRQQHPHPRGRHARGRASSAALTTVLNAYGLKIQAFSRTTIRSPARTCREGITAVISVKLTEAQFEGQTKAKLGNADIRTLVDGIVNDQLAVYLEEHPVVARTILDKAMTANRAREAATQGPGVHPAQDGAGRRGYAG